MTACDLCKGACCEAIVLPFVFKDEDIQRWFAYHGTETNRGLQFDCKCNKLKNGKCSIYEDRPNVCRDFTVGSPGCLAAVRRRRPFKEKEIVALITK